MGFFSWFSSCGTVGEDDPPTLVHTNYSDDDPELAEICMHMTLALLHRKLAL